MIKKLILLLTLTAFAFSACAVYAYPGIDYMFYDSETNGYYVYGHYDKSLSVPSDVGIYSGADKYSIINNEVGYSNYNLANVMENPRYGIGLLCPEPNYLSPFAATPYADYGENEQLGEKTFLDEAANEAIIKDTVFFENFTESASVPPCLAASAGAGTSVSVVKQTDEDGIEKNMLKMDDGSESKAAIISFSLDDYTTPVVFEIKFKMKSTTTNGMGFIMNFQDEGANAFRIIKYADSAADAFCFVNNGGNNNFSRGADFDNKWYTMKVRIDPDLKQSAVILEGEELGAVDLNIGTSANVWQDKPNNRVVAYSQPWYTEFSGEKVTGISLQTYAKSCGEYYIDYIRILQNELEAQFRPVRIRAAGKTADTIPDPVYRGIINGMFVPSGQETLYFEDFTSVSGIPSGISAVREADTDYGIVSYPDKEGVTKNMLKLTDSSTSNSASFELFLSNYSEPQLSFEMRFKMKKTASTAGFGFVLEPRNGSSSAIRIAKYNSASSTINVENSFGRNDISNGAAFDDEWFTLKLLLDRSSRESTVILESDNLGAADIDTGNSRNVLHDKLGKRIIAYAQPWYSEFGLSALDRILFKTYGSTCGEYYIDYVRIIGNPDPADFRAELTPDPIAESSLFFEDFTSSLSVPESLNYTAAENTSYGIVSYANKEGVTKNMLKLTDNASADAADYASFTLPISEYESSDPIVFETRFKIVKAANVNGYGFVLEPKKGNTRAYKLAKYGGLSSPIRTENGVTNNNLTDGVTVNGEWFTLKLLLDKTNRKCSLVLENDNFGTTDLNLTDTTNIWQDKENCRVVEYDRDWYSSCASDIDKIVFQTYGASSCGEYYFDYIRITDDIDLDEFAPPQQETEEPEPEEPQNLPAVIYSEDFTSSSGIPADFAMSAKYADTDYGIVSYANKEGITKNMLKITDNSDKFGTGFTLPISDYTKDQLVFETRFKIVDISNNGFVLNFRNGTGNANRAFRLVKFNNAGSGITLYYGSEQANNFSRGAQFNSEWFVMKILIDNENRRYSVILENDNLGTATLNLNGTTNVWHDTANNRILSYNLPWYNAFPENTAVAAAEFTSYTSSSRGEYYFDYFKITENPDLSEFAPPEQ